MGTQVTLELLKAYLERAGMQGYQKEERIYTGWQIKPGQGYTTIIRVHPDKNVVSFVVPDVLTVPPLLYPPERLRDFLMALHFLNYELVLGKFSYDPRDGEVRFEIFVPVDETTLTFDQFAHCIKAMLATVETEVPKLKAMLEGKKSLHEFLQEELGS